MGRMRRAARLAAAAAIATAMTVGQAHAATMPTLQIQAPKAAYVSAPGTTAPSGDKDGEIFDLSLNLACVEGEDPVAKDVVLTVDATSLVGKATLKASGGCTQPHIDKPVFTCSFSSIDGLTSVQTLRIKGADGAKIGDTGTLAFTATASNAATVTASTKITVGGPQLTTRKHGP